MSDAASRYLEYLPMMYREDPLLGNFLLGFERVLDGIEATIDRLDQYVRPREKSGQAPAEFLPWLASWLGFALHHQWSEGQRRNLLFGARWLHDRRGTSEGLKAFLELGLMFEGVHGVSVTIAEPNDKPGFFNVTVNPGVRSTAAILRATQVARWIIDRERPAHTQYCLHVVAPTMQIVSDPKGDEGIRVGQTLLGSD